MPNKQTGKIAWKPMTSRSSRSRRMARGGTSANYNIPEYTCTCAEPSGDPSGKMPYFVWTCPDPDPPGSPGYCSCCNHGPLGGDLELR